MGEAPTAKKENFLVAVGLLAYVAGLYGLVWLVDNVLPHPKPLVAFILFFLFCWLLAVLYSKIRRPKFYDWREVEF